MTKKEEILALSNKINKMKFERDAIWDDISSQVQDMESINKEITHYYRLIAEQFDISYYRHDQLTIEKFLEFYKKDK